jgi:glycosyltransferase involved in cell wall biosynthesis
VRVIVVIPALDEEASLPLVLDAIPKGTAEEIVVVDNGSADRTAEVARSRGATVLLEPARGYGAACLRGLEHVARRSPDVVVFLDADFSDDPREMPALLDPIARNTADLVIGSRVLGRQEAGALPPQQRLGNWVATRTMRLVFGGCFTDLGPFRAVRFRALMGLGMVDRGYGWTAEMQVKALKSGLRVREAPVSCRRRVGRSKISGTLSGSLKAGGKILWTIARHAI